MNREQGIDFLRRLRRTLDLSLDRVSEPTRLQIEKVRQRALDKVALAEKHKDDKGQGKTPRRTRD